MKVIRFDIAILIKMLKINNTSHQNVAPLR